MIYFFHLSVALMALLLGSGCRLPQPFQGAQEPLRPEVPPVPEFYSVKGRPISYEVLGKGPVNVHFHAGIHGSEPEGVALVERLAEFLKANPDHLEYLRVILIPRANPDGLLAKTRTNANKVDLNRNFPAGNWRRLSRGRSGPAARSEPETRTLMKLIDRWPPGLVVSLHSPRHSVNWDGPCRDLAQKMSEKNGYRTEATVGYPTPGSLGSWLGCDRKVPIITLELPRGDFQKLWSENQAAFLVALKWAAQSRYLRRSVSEKLEAVSN